MTHNGDYLGIAKTGKDATLRVMDFYRISENKIAENWVFLDLIDLASQLGFNVFDN